MLQWNYKCVLDVNIWIKLLFNNPDVFTIIECDNVFIYTTEELIDEINLVLEYEHILEYTTQKQRKALKQIVAKRAIPIRKSSVIKICRDPDDDYLLGIRKDVNADYLITEDKDLLTLKKFKKTEIVDLRTFITVISQ